MEGTLDGSPEGLLEWPLGGTTREDAGGDVGDIAGEEALMVPLEGGHWRGGS